MSSTAIIYPSSSAFIIPGWKTQLFDKLEICSLYLSVPMYRASETILRSFITPIRPGKDGNHRFYLVELISRIFFVALSIVSSPATVGLALLGAALEKTSDIVKQTPYTHWRGNAQEKEETQNRRLLTNNSCMLRGGLPIPFGGMRPARYRSEELSKMILEKDPDVLCLQEMTFEPSYSLFSKLKDRYAHFFIRIGPNSPLIESGLFIASKYLVLRAGFIPFPKQCGIKRGGFWIETPKSYYFTALLEPGMTLEDQEKRKTQFALLLKQIKQFKQHKPCFLLGDLNTDRTQNKKEYVDLGIPEHFHDPYFTKYPSITKQSSTCTNEITAYTRGEKPPKDHPWELDDYALLAKGPHDQLRLNVEVIPTYNEKEPYQALSDHKMLFMTTSVA